MMTCPDIYTRYKIKVLDLKTILILNLKFDSNILYMLKNSDCLYNSSNKVEGACLFQDLNNM